MLALSMEDQLILYEVKGGTVLNLWFTELKSLIPSSNKKKNSIPIVSDFKSAKSENF